MIDVEVLWGKAEVMGAVKALLSAHSSFRSGQLCFEELREKYGYSVAEAIRRSKNKDGLYFPYRKGYRAFVRVAGNMVEFWLHKKLLGVGRLSRPIDPQNCQIGIAIEKGKLVLKFYVHVKEAEKLPQEQLLKTYRQLAFREVPEVFKESLANSLKPRVIFFGEDGTPKTNFELRAIEDYAKVAVEGRFMCFWNCFVKVRNEIAMKNQNLIPAVLRQMHIQSSDWEELMLECTVVLLRGVGMWDPDKGKLSTLVFRQMKATIQHELERKIRTVSLDNPISDGEETTFADMLHDPRSYEGELFFNLAEVV